MSAPAPAGPNWAKVVTALRMLMPEMLKILDQIYAVRHFQFITCAMMNPAVQELRNELDALEVRFNASEDKCILLYPFYFKISSSLRSMLRIANATRGLGALLHYPGAK